MGRLKTSLPESLAAAVKATTADWQSGGKVKRLSNRDMSLPSSFSIRLTRQSGGRPRSAGSSGQQFEGEIGDPFDGDSEGTCSSLEGVFRIPVPRTKREQWERPPQLSDGFFD